MEQLVLILIIGAISLINWLIEQSGKRREQRRLKKEREDSQAGEIDHQDSSSPGDRTRPATQLEPSREVRELLEVFGVPLPAQESPSTPIPIFQESPVRLPQSASSPSSLQNKPKRKTPPAPIQPSIKTPQSLRQAIVWREILGTPRSLQPY